MIKTYKPEIDKLLKDIITDLEYRGIKPLFSLTDYVEGQSVRSNGFFDSDCREFAVAIGKPLHLWLRTFVHESCHFDQWKEKCDCWREYDQLLPNEEDLLWDWLDGKVETITNIEDIHHFDSSKKRIIHFDQLRKVAALTRELERDCEERVIAKVREYNLPIPIEDYARQGNAYVCFYDYILESRAWYIIGKEPYNNENLKMLMPSKIFKGQEIQLTLPMREEYAKCVSQGV